MILSNGVPSSEKQVSSLKSAMGTTKYKAKWDEMRETLSLHRKFLRNIFLLISLVAVTITVRSFLYKSIYHARATIFYHEAKTRLSLGTNAMDIMGGTTTINDPLLQLQNFLNRHEFFLIAARKLLSDPALPENLKWLPAAVTVSNDFNFNRFVARAIDRLLYQRVAPPENEKTPEQILAWDLSGYISVKREVPNTIFVQAALRNPYRAVELANYIAQLAVETVIQQESQKLDNIQQMSASELKKSTERQLASEEEAILLTKKAAIPLGPDGSTKDLVAQVQTIEQQIFNGEMKINYNKKLIAEYSAEFERREKELLSGAPVETADWTLLSQIRLRIQALHSKRNMILAEGYEESSPYVRQLDEQIRQLTTREKTFLSERGHSAGLIIDKKDDQTLLGLIVGLKRENEQIETSLEFLRKGLVEARAPLKGLPEIQQGFARSLRTSQMEALIIQELRKRILDTELSKISLVDKIRVVDLATATTIVSSLSLFSRVVIALLVSAVLSFLLLLARDGLDKTVRATSDLTRLGIDQTVALPSTGSSFLAGFPTFAWLEQSNSPTGEKSPGLKDKLGYLRALLLKLASNGERTRKVTAVLSPRRTERTLFLSLNVATGFAQVGKRTLWIGCDFESKVEPWVGGELQKPGLGALLSGTKNIEECIIRNFVSDLDLLPQDRVGEDNITERLSSTAFRELLETLKGRYDMIVLNLPSALEAPVSLTLADLSDIILLSATRRITTHEDLEGTIETLSLLQGKIIVGALNGTVGESAPLNNFTKTRSPESKGSWAALLSRRPSFRST